jgi:predicted acylesterase/phospholipase RssA
MAAAGVPAHRSGPRVGVVLGAGGVLGAAWMIGALVAVQERLGFAVGEAELVVGTSAGSVLAAALRCGVGIEAMVAHQRGALVGGVPDLGPPDLGGRSLPPPPLLRVGSPRLMLAALRAPHRMHPWVAASALLPQGRARHVALHSMVHAMVSHAWPHLPPHGGSHGGLTGVIHSARHGGNHPGPVDLHDAAGPVGAARAAVGRVKVAAAAACAHASTGGPGAAVGSAGPRAATGIGAAAGLSGPGAPIDAVPIDAVPIDAVPVAGAGDVRAEWARDGRTWIVAVDYDSGQRVVFGRPGAPAAALPDAVVASCSIPGWFRPAVIDGRRYVDGGLRSATSAGLLAEEELDEAYVLAPMASLAFDRPRMPHERLERRLRRLMTVGLRREVERLRSAGTKVTVLTPGPEDLAAIGANLMDPRRRLGVLETSLRTSAAALAAGTEVTPPPGRTHAA